AFQSFELAGFTGGDGGGDFATATTFVAGGFLSTIAGGREAGGGTASRCLMAESGTDSSLIQVVANTTRLVSSEIRFPAIRSPLCRCRIICSACAHLNPRLNKVASRMT